MSSTSLWLAFLFVVAGLVLIVSLGLMVVYYYWSGGRSKYKKPKGK